MSKTKQGEKLAIKTRNRFMKSTNDIYTPEYRATRCVQCGKLLSGHRRYTQADVDASQGATYDKPVNGYLCPMSPCVIGEWIGHAPMPWRTQA